MKKDIIPVEIIENRILLIRNKKVMLDRDLAELYGVETKVLKQAVRRNIKRFPVDFMFELKSDEERSLRSQNVTLKRGQHSKYLSFAFTEQGVAMLSSVINSERAIEVNIQIMRAFVILSARRGIPVIKVDFLNCIARTRSQNGAHAKHSGKTA